LQKKAVNEMDCWVAKSDAMWSEKICTVKNISENDCVCF